ncbi:hypothetical protein ABPG77_002846 [Micractinium sp. CCAP 211/92]
MSSSDDELPPEAVPLGAAPASGRATGAAAEDPDAHAAGAEPSSAAPGAPPVPVPVTLITGYLGAGKTTLVNWVLTARHGFRCAVLLNEIADSADIERALVKEPEGQEASPLAEWTELENGCICCSAKNDMVKALESLMQQRDRFDYVLIETTGLANPGPVAAALWTDEQLESSVCLDCIVTVVDARHIRRQLADPRPDGAVNEAQQQVAFADVVLLNKTDLASEAELAEVEAEIRRINAEAGITRCQRCQIDLSRILNTGLYSASSQPAAATAAFPVDAPASSGGGYEGGQQAAPSQEAAPAAGTGGAESVPAPQQASQQQPAGSSNEGAPCEDPQCSDPHHHHHHHQQEGGMHDARVGTVTIHLPGAPLDLPRLRRWLDTLLWEETAEAADLFRIKGLLHVAGSDRKHILQGVHEIYDIVEGPDWAAGEQRASKLVFIGRRLRRDALAADLAACQAEQ